jgi:hypothetical protein
VLHTEADPQRALGEAPSALPSRPWNLVKRKLKKVYLFRLLHAYWRATKGRNSQSNESEILLRLVKETNAPKSFIEFGFNIHEYNCIALEKEFRGLLFDGDGDSVRIARHFLPKNVSAEHKFLTLDNLNELIERFKPRELGILSIDVDGNDYWFLEKMLVMQPAIVSVEYNASIGTRTLTVPYDATFSRQDKHPSGWYHGASCTALTALCEKNGYDLVAFDTCGANMFLVRSDLRPLSVPKINATEHAYENLLRNAWSRSDAVHQWKVIRHLPFVDVSKFSP